jgi:hypothetical protein
MTDTLLAETQAEIERLKAMAQPRYTASGLTRRAELLFAGLILVGVLVFIWDRLTPPPSPVGAYAVAVPNKVLASVPKEVIQPKSLKVYSKPAKKKLNLPDEIQQDDNMYVLSSSTLKHDYHPQTVTTIVDKETGETRVLPRREAYPWFAFEQTGSTELTCGFKTISGKTCRGEISEYVVQVKALHLGGKVTLDSDGSGYVGIGLKGNW